MPQLGAETGVAGLFSQPERGVCGQGEQRRQPGAGTIEDLQGIIAIGDADMHMAAEDNQLMRNLLEGSVKVGIAFLGREFLVAPSVKTGAFPPPRFHCLTDAPPR